MEKKTEEGEHEETEDIGRRRGACHKNDGAAIKVTATQSSYCGFTALPPRPLIKTDHHFTFCYMCVTSHSLHNVFSRILKSDPKQAI